MRAEIENLKDEITKSLKLLRGLLDIDKCKKKLIAFEKEINKPNFWTIPQKASLLLREKKNLENSITCFTNINKNFSENVELANIANEENDEYLLDEIENNLKELIKTTTKFRTECLFSGENDINNCFVEIHAGAGGLESYDWASMMLRMYLRFAERLGFEKEIINISTEANLVKSCCIKIKGDRAFGWFRTESGVHRLVRISPFNATGKRMTSFSSCWVYPEIHDNMDIVIEEKDLRIDTYRSSGAGGQHVNTTDSAVRITHIPTNIVVQCQNDRSQHRNKAESMNMLKARLYDLKIKKQNEEIERKNAAKSNISWGYQIRSYILQPYQMVKDIRTDYETSNINSVLDGDLENFISAALVQKKCLLTF